MGKEIKMTASKAKKSNKLSAEKTESIDNKAPDNTKTVNEYQFLTTEGLADTSLEDLLAQQDELNKAQETFGKAMAHKLYAVKFDSQSSLSMLKKWVEKETKWNHNSVPTLVAMYDGLKKAVTSGLDEDNNAHLSTIVVANIYQYLLTFEGKGYLEAKSYLTLLTKIGGPISEAMKELADDNTHFRNMHADLATLDQVITAKQQGIAIALTPTEEGQG